MKITKTVSVGLLAALLTSALSYADEAKQESKSAENPFAECGIGAAIFKNDTAAMFSNFIWDLGSTALTSGFSSPGSCSDLKAKTAAFIYKSYNELAEQTAKGSGNYLTAMLSLSGCSASSHAQIIDQVRADFASEISDKSYTNASALHKAESYYNIVAANTKGICKLG